MTPIDMYINAQPEEIQPVLKEIRKTIKEAAPESIEKISYQMPTFYLKKNIIHFAVLKNHIGLYPGPKAIEFFADRIKYKTSKGTIRIPMKEEIPHDLISEMVKFNVELYSN